MEPIAVNEAEGLLAPFYQAYSQAGAWDFFCDADTAGEIHPSWDTVRLGWGMAVSGKIAAALKRECDFSLAHYDHLMLRCNLYDWCRLTLRAVVDGVEQVVIDSVPGQNIYHEFSGPVSGTHLTRLTIEIVPQRDEAAVLSLLWLGCFDSARLSFMQNRPSPYDGEWGTYLTEPAAGLEPALGVHIGMEELTAIRDKITREPYREMFNRLRHKAHGYLGTLPHRSIRSHLEHPEYRGSRYDRDSAATIPDRERIDPKAMRLCAFVGLVDNDPTVARCALKHALAAAHCTHWDDSFIETLPGSLWDHRAFTANEFMNGFLAACDWAGSLLTPDGRSLMGRTVCRTVLPLVDRSLRLYGYMRHNNQAIVFARTGIMSLAMLGRIYEYGADGLDWYLDVLRQSIENYIEPDGGSYEGMAYFNWSCGTALEGFFLASRMRNVPFESLVPACLRNTPAYYRIMASTAEAGTFINYADGGRVGLRFDGCALPLLWHMTKDPALAGLIAAGYTPETAGTIPALMWGPDPMPHPDAAIPEFAILPDTALLCSCRPTLHGPVRLQMIGAKPHAGHTHEDKGSFVLEAFGEEILIDRGVCTYGDVRSTQMQNALRHNMLTPNNQDGTPLASINPCPEATIPSGSGDTTTLHASIDATAPWKKFLARWIRRCDSTTPTEIILTDFAERLEEGTVSVHFQSRAPWIRTDEGWTATGTKAAVTITPRWKVASFEAVEDLTDSRYTPVYRLTLRSESGRDFELKTDLTVAPVITTESEA